MRRGAVAASVPVEVAEAESTAAARKKIVASTIDVIFLHATIPPEERSACVQQARSSEHKPFIILVAATVEEAQGLAEQGSADSAVIKPADVGQAKALVERCARLRLPIAFGGRRLPDDARHCAQDSIQASRFRLKTDRGAGGLSTRSGRSRAASSISCSSTTTCPASTVVETLIEIKRHFSGLRSGDHDEATRASPVVEQARRRRRCRDFFKNRSTRPTSMRILQRIFGLAGAHSEFSHQRRRTARCRRAQCDPVERVDAELHHVLVVGAGHDPEQFDPLLSGVSALSGMRAK